MKNSRYKFYIDGIEVNNPMEWQEIQILSTFDNDAIQSNLSTSELIFPLESARAIKNYVNSGLNGGVGIFEGLPFQIQVINEDSIFLDEYILDFETYRETEDNKVAISFRLQNGLNQVSDRLEAITFGYLESEGIITSADYITLPYVVQKISNAQEIILLIITTAFTAKATADSILNISKTYSDAVAHAAGGISGAFASTVYVVATTLIAIAYAAALLLAFSKLFLNLMSYLIPLPRTHKAMTFRKLMEKVCEYLGYTLDSNLPLDNYVYLPSNNTQDIYGDNGFIKIPKGIQKGIPNSNDYGYALSEFVDLAKRIFNAKFSIVDNVMYFRTKSDPFWIQTSTFKMRSDTFIDEFSYNNKDLKANILIQYLTDLTDKWTIADFKGTNYEIITTPIIVNNEKNVLVKGLDRVQIPMALGSKKTRKTPFDNILIGTAKVLDGISKFFGGNSNYTEKIKIAIKSLRVSDNNHTIPKLIYIDDNGIIPENHRDFTSAKYLWNTWHSERSFVLNNYYGQKKLFKNIRIPFGYDDWVALRNNSYIDNQDVVESKVESLQWTVGGDSATVDFFERVPYTKNLQENYIEAE